MIQVVVQHANVPIATVQVNGQQLQALVTYEWRRPLEQMAALNREIDAYRSEAAAAGSALHSAVERINTRLVSEESQLDRLRAESAAAEVASLEGAAGERGLGGAAVLPHDGHGLAEWRHARGKLRRRLPHRHHRRPRRPAGRTAVASGRKLR